MPKPRSSGNKKEKREKKDKKSKKSLDPNFSDSSSSDSKGPILPTPVPVEPGCVGNTVYVDSICGNDATGKPFSSKFPFLTINTAINSVKENTKENIIEVIVRPGNYNEGIIFLRNNISLQGSGRLATQIQGSFDTSLVDKEATVLELSISNIENPAIFGYGNGRISFRRMRFNSTYISNISGQSAALVLSGNHIFSESEGSLNNNGGLDVAVYRHLGGFLETERNSHTLTSASLRQIFVNPRLTTFIPNIGGVEYVVTGSGQTIILPYEETSVPVTSIARPFLITVNIAGNLISPPTIQNINTNITLNNKTSVAANIENIVNNGRIYVLGPAVPITQVPSLENANIYKVGDNTNNITIPENGSQKIQTPTTNVPLIVNITGGKGTLTLPKNIGSGFIINNFSSNSKYKLNIRQSKDKCHKYKEIKLDKNSKTIVRFINNEITVIRTTLNETSFIHRIRQLNNRSEINSSLITSDTANTEAAGTIAPFPPFSGNPVTGNVSIPQNGGGLNYVAGSTDTTFMPFFGNTGQGFLLSHAFIVTIPVSNATYIFQTSPMPFQPPPQLTAGIYVIFPIAGGTPNAQYGIVLANPQVNNVGETHNLLVPGPQQLQGSSTNFPFFPGNPTVPPFTITQGGFAYNVPINGNDLTAALNPDGTSAVTSAFTVTPVGLATLSFITDNLGTKYIMVAGNTYLVTPGTSGYNVSPITVTNGSPTTTLSNSGTFSVINFTNFNLPSTPDARLFIFNVSQRGIGSVVNALGGQTISGQGSSFTFTRAGFYRFNNFLAPGNWIVTFFPANHKVVQIAGNVGATPVTFPPFPGNPLTGNQINITEGGFNYVTAANPGTLIFSETAQPYSITLTGDPSSFIQLSVPTVATYFLFGSRTYIVSNNVPGIAGFPILPQAPGDPITLPTNQFPAILNATSGFNYQVVANGASFYPSASFITITVVGSGPPLVFFFRSSGPQPTNQPRLFPGNTYLILGTSGSLVSPVLVQPDSSNLAAPRVKFNNTTVETGTHLDTLIESDSTTAKAHLNNIGIMERKDLPAFIIPAGHEDNNYHIQQIGTEQDHYRGGNQIERTSPAPIISGVTYEVQEKDHTLILGGNDNIILPLIIPLNGQPTPNVPEVPNGTRFIIQNVSGSQGPSTITARGLNFSCGTNATGSITLQVNETLYLTAIASNVTSPSSLTYYHVSRTQCLP